MTSSRRLLPIKLAGLSAILLMLVGTLVLIVQIMNAPDSIRLPRNGGDYHAAKAGTVTISVENVGARSRPFRPRATFTVTSSEGRHLEVSQDQGTSYSKGRRHGWSVAKFEARRIGTYRIATQTAEEEVTNLTVGPKQPFPWLGFGLLMAGGVGLLGVAGLLLAMFGRPRSR